MMTEMTTTEGDHWQGRLDLVARFAPAPLLAVSCALAALLTSEGFGGWTRFGGAVGLAALAAVWGLTVTSRAVLGPAAASVGFAVQWSISAVLVGLNPWFG